MALDKGIHNSQLSKAFAAGKPLNVSHCISHSRLKTSATHMKFILPLLLLALLSSCSTTGDHAPSAIKIEGRVIDNRKHAVKGVHVQAEGFKTVLTNEKGEFALIGPAPQADSLTVNFVAPGFKPTTEVYTRTANGINGVAIWPRARGTGNGVIIWPRR
jgi:hypothetical protein